MAEKEDKSIQDKAYAIIDKFGNTEIGRYKIQLMCDEHAQKYLEKHKHKLIDEQVKILKDTLEEMITGFDTEENKINFILDICNGYKKRIDNE